MPFGTENRGVPEYSFQVHNDSWEQENMAGVYFNCTLADAGARTEAEMDVIAQEIYDALAAAGFDTVSGSKSVRLGAEITPTP